MTSRRPRSGVAVAAVHLAAASATPRAGLSVRALDFEGRAKSTGESYALIHIEQAR